MCGSPSPALHTLALQSKWHLVSIFAFDFFAVVLLKAKNFHAGLIEEPPSQMMDVPCSPKLKKHSETQK